MNCYNMSERISKLLLKFGDSSNFPNVLEEEAGSVLFVDIVTDLINDNGI